jgi:hypothetical protein
MTATGLIRRIVLWRWNESATPALRQRAKEGLAYTRFGGHVDDLDFGEDLRLGIGPGRAYDLALLRDHVDQRSWDIYVDDPLHKRVGDEIDQITRMDETARIDFIYEGPPAVRGHIRHIALYWWRQPVNSATYDRLRAALDRLRSGDGAPTGLAYGQDLALGTAHADFALEAHVPDEAALRAFIDRAAVEIDPLLPEIADTARTASLQHRMLSG